ncbi:unnamed protein product [Amoebophrya sp. A25]|nr:unnamed protein product [Amoebophrya sp. A25]|eukprot:GSA25T00011765001.1
MLVVYDSQSCYFFRRGEPCAITVVPHGDTFPPCPGDVREKMTFSGQELKDLLSSQTFTGFFDRIEDEEVVRHNLGFGFVAAENRSASESSDGSTSELTSSSSKVSSGSFPGPYDYHEKLLGGRETEESGTQSASTRVGGDASCSSASCNSVSGPFVETGEPGHDPFNPVPKTIPRQMLPFATFLKDDSLSEGGDSASPGTDADNGRSNAGAIAPPPLRKAVGGSSSKTSSVSSLSRNSSHGVSQWPSQGTTCASSVASRAADGVAARRRRRQEAKATPFAAAADNHEGPMRSFSVLESVAEMMHECGGGPVMWVNNRKLAQQEFVDNDGNVEGIRVAVERLSAKYQRLQISLDICDLSTTSILGVGKNREDLKADMDELDARGAANCLPEVLALRQLTESLGGRYVSEPEYNHFPVEPVNKTVPNAFEPAGRRRRDQNKEASTLAIVAEEHVTTLHGGTASKGRATSLSAAAMGGGGGGEGFLETDIVANGGCTDVLGDKVKPIQRRVLTFAELAERQARQRGLLQDHDDVCSEASEEEEVMEERRRVSRQGSSAGTPVDVVFPPYAGDGGDNAIPTVGSVPFDPAAHRGRIQASNTSSAAGNMMRRNNDLASKYCHTANAQAVTRRCKYSNPRNMLISDGHLFCFTRTGILLDPNMMQRGTEPERGIWERYNGKSRNQMALMDEFCEYDRISDRYHANWKVRLGSAVVAPASSSTAATGRGYHGGLLRPRERSKFFASNNPSITSSVGSSNGIGDSSGKSTPPVRLSATLGGVVPNPQKVNELHVHKQRLCRRTMQVGLVLKFALEEFFFEWRYGYSRGRIQCRVSDNYKVVEALNDRMMKDIDGFFLPKIGPAHSYNFRLVPSGTRIGDVQKGEKLLAPTGGTRAGGLLAAAASGISNVASGGEPAGSQESTPTHHQVGRPGHLNSVWSNMSPHGLAAGGSSGTNNSVTGMPGADPVLPPPSPDQTPVKKSWPMPTVLLGDGIRPGDLFDMGGPQSPIKKGGHFGSGTRLSRDFLNGSVPSSSCYNNSAGASLMGCGRAGFNSTTASSSAPPLAEDGRAGSYYNIGRNLPSGAEGSGAGRTGPKTCVYLNEGNCVLTMGHVQEQTCAKKAINLNRYCQIQTILNFRENYTGKRKVRVCSCTLPIGAGLRSLYERANVWPLSNLMFKLPETEPKIDWSCYDKATSSTTTTTALGASPPKRVRVQADLKHAMQRQDEDLLEHLESLAEPEKPPTDKQLRVRVRQKESSPADAVITALAEEPVEGRFDAMGALARDPSKESSSSSSSSCAVIPPLEDEDPPASARKKFSRSQLVPTNPKALTPSQLQALLCATSTAGASADRLVRLFLALGMRNRRRTMSLQKGEGHTEPSVCDEHGHRQNYDTIEDICGRFAQLATYYRRLLLPYTTCLHHEAAFEITARSAAESVALLLRRWAKSYFEMLEQDLKFRPRHVYMPTNLRHLPLLALGVKRRLRQVCSLWPRRRMGISHSCYFMYPRCFSPELHSQALHWRHIVTQNQDPILVMFDGQRMLILVSEDFFRCNDSVEFVKRRKIVTAKPNSYLLGARPEEDDGTTAVGTFVVTPSDGTPSDAGEDEEPVGILDQILRRYLLYVKSTGPYEEWSREYSKAETTPDKNSNLPSSTELMCRDGTSVGAAPPTPEKPAPEEDEDGPRWCEGYSFNCSQMSPKMGRFLCEFDERNLFSDRPGGRSAKARDSSTSETVLVEGGPGMVRPCRPEDLRAYSQIQHQQAQQRLRRQMEASGNVLMRAAHVPPSAQSPNIKKQAHAPGGTRIASPDKSAPSRGGWSPGRNGGKGKATPAVGPICVPVIVGSVGDYERVLARQEGERAVPQIHASAQAPVSLRPRTLGYRTETAYSSSSCEASSSSSSGSGEGRSSSSSGVELYSTGCSKEPRSSSATRETPSSNESPSCSADMDSYSTSNDCSSSCRSDTPRKRVRLTNVELQRLRILSRAVTDFLLEVRCEMNFYSLELVFLKDRADFFREDIHGVKSHFLMEDETSTDESYLGFVESLHRMLSCNGNFWRGRFDKFFTRTS